MRSPTRRLFGWLRRHLFELLMDEQLPPFAIDERLVVTDWASRRKGYWAVRGRLTLTSKRLIFVSHSPTLWRELSKTLVVELSDICSTNLGRRDWHSPRAAVRAGNRTVDRARYGSEPGGTEPTRQGRSRPEGHFRTLDSRLPVLEAADEVGVEGRPRTSRSSSSLVGPVTRVDNSTLISLRWV